MPKRGKKKGKKGRKRKSRLSEAAAKQARQRHQDHGLQQIPIHPDDLEPNEPSLFHHSFKGSTGWRCLECRYGFGAEYGTWRAQPNSQERCPRCRSPRIHQQDCLYECLNCETEYWQFPGGPPRKDFSDPSCPNPQCKETTGPKHPGTSAERGKYVKWLNYEEWVQAHEH